MWALTPEAQTYKDSKRKLVDAERAEKKQPPLTDYQSDMWCFNKHPWGHRNKWQFLVRAMQHQWGDKMMFETVINGQRFVNYWSIRILQEVCRSKLINALGCASSSKTHTITCYGYTLWKAAPWETSVYLSTTSGESADARAWATVQDIYREDKQRYGKMINSVRTLVMEDVNEDEAKTRDLRNSLKCVLIRAGNEGRNVVAAISGRKNKRVLWACDEMQHMDVGVLSGRVNLMSNAVFGGWSQFIGSGNGPKDGDPLYIDAEPENGWKSINKDENFRWVTKSGVCLYFNGAKSPNMAVERGERPPFPGIMDWSAHDAILSACFGNTASPEFYIQFHGFPPSVDIADTVLTKALMESGGAFGQCEWDGSPRKTIAGLDVGFRRDGDPCVIHFGQIGKCADGRTRLNCDGDAKEIVPSQNSPLPYEEQIAIQVVSLCVERGCHNLSVDVTGDGGIMVQAIEKQARKEGFQLAVRAVSFGGTAEDKIVIQGDKRKGTEMFDRMVSQLWASTRIYTGLGVLKGLAERGRSTSQLCQRKFHTDEKRRFSVETKKEMKKRLRRSPDHGDATVLLCFEASKNGLSGHEVAKPQPKALPAPPVQRYAGHGHVSRYSRR